MKKNRKKVGKTELDKNKSIVNIGDKKVKIKTRSLKKKVPVKTHLHNNEYSLFLEGVTKKFGEAGIDEITMKIKKGSFHVLVGPNGAGKTTLIRTILGLYQEYSGNIFINGINSRNPLSLNNLAYISENPIFPSEFNAYEYLYWAGILSDVEKEYLKSKIISLAKQFNISNCLKKNPNKLSSGQKQKIMLMKIIIQNANIIIMDEPTANLDPTARIVFFEEIEKMHKQGKTIFLCSHNLDEVEKKVTDVSILCDGRIILNQKKSDDITLMSLFKENIKKYQKSLEDNDE